MNTELKNHIIDLYRESINKRYTFENIKKDPNLPKSFTKETVDELRDFFLDNLYSSPKERDKLDKAFQQLESYVSHPSKVFGLVGNLASAIFEFGFHLPQAIHTGSVTLRTHSAARHFENDLLAVAESKNFPIPFTEEQFNECLAALPYEQIEQFIVELTDLFKSISDTFVLDKTISILGRVLSKMKQKTDTYGQDDFDAIQLGIDILSHGKVLLSKYDDTLKEDIVTFITYSETKFLKSLKKKKKS